MRESIELRVNPEFYRELFVPDDGDVDEMVFIVRLDADDPRLAGVAALQRKCRKIGRTLVYSWQFQRTYSQAELEAAELFHLVITSHFEPAGEECGTTYDESNACPICGAGRTQQSPLRLDVARIPTRAALAQSIAVDERVCSLSLATAVLDAGLSGFRFPPVIHRRSDFEWESRNLRKYSAGREVLRLAEQAGAPHDTDKFWLWAQGSDAEAPIAALRRELERTAGSKSLALPRFFQLLPGVAEVDVVAPTKFGDDPFDDQTASASSCPSGHVAGLNILSELHVSRSSWNGDDFAATRAKVGRSSGLVRPAPLMLVSPRFRQIAQGMKGFTLEVVNLH